MICRISIYCAREVCKYIWVYEIQKIFNVCCVGAYWWLLWIYFPCFTIEDVDQLAFIAFTHAIFHLIKTFTPARGRAGRIILILSTYHSLLKYSNNGGKKSHFTTGRICTYCLVRRQLKVKLWTGRSILSTGGKTLFMAYRWVRLGVCHKIFPPCYGWKNFVA